MRKHSHLRWDTPTAECCSIITGRSLNQRMLTDTGTFGQQQRKKLCRWSPTPERGGLARQLDSSSVVFLLDRSELFSASPATTCTQRIRRLSQKLLLRDQSVCVKPKELPYAMQSNTLSRP